MSNEKTIQSQFITIETGLLSNLEARKKHDLSVLDLLLLKLIQSLDTDKQKGCYASSTYLAACLGVTAASIRNMLSKLRKYELVFDIWITDSSRGLRIDTETLYKMFDLHTTKKEAVKRTKGVIVGLQGCHSTITPPVITGLHPLSSQDYTDNKDYNKDYNKEDREQKNSFSPPSNPSFSSKDECLEQPLLGREIDDINKVINKHVTDKAKNIKFKDSFLVERDAVQRCEMLATTYSDGKYQDLDFAHYIEQISEYVESKKPNYSAVNWFLALMVWAKRDGTKMKYRGQIQNTNHNNNKAGASQQLETAVKNTMSWRP